MIRPPPPQRKLPKSPACNQAALDLKKNFIDININKQPNLNKLDSFTRDYKKVCDPTEEEIIFIDGILRLIQRNNFVEVENEKIKNENKKLQSNYNDLEKSCKKEKPKTVNEKTMKLDKKIAKQILDKINKKDESDLENLCDKLMENTYYEDDYKRMKNTKSKYETLTLCKTASMNAIQK
jgi:hypothetical protein